MNALRSAVLSETLADIRKVARSQGIFIALRYVLRIVKSHLFLHRGAILFARSLQGVLPDEEMDESLTVREMTAQDLPLIASTSKADSEFCRRLLEGGATGLIALKDSQLAGYLWFAPDVDLRLHQIYLPLAPGEVYAFNIVTMPAFRRQGIQKTLHHRMFCLLRDAGWKRVLVLVGLDNYPSLQMSSRLYRVVGHLARVKVFRLMYFRYDPQLPGEPRHIVKWLGM